MKPVGYRDCSSPPKPAILHTFGLPPPPRHARPTDLHSHPLVLDATTRQQGKWIALWKIELGKDVTRQQHAKDSKLAWVMRMKLGAEKEKLRSPRWACVRVFAWDPRFSSEIRPKPMRLAVVSIVSMVERVREIQEHMVDRLHKGYLHNKFDLCNMYRGTYIPLYPQRSYGVQEILTRNAPPKTPSPCSVPKIKNFPTP